MNPLKLNTASVSLAVTPTVVSTLLSHYLNRKPLRHRPTAHLSYDEGLHLIRSFLQYASQHTVEELQAFTSQWVPHPQWVQVDKVRLPAEILEKAAELLQAQLGEDGIRRVGGKKWWQWRKDEKPLKAEWIEMKSDYQERKLSGQRGRRVMLYVHGGAYFFGSVDEHRYQLQRHARKLKARVFAPKYRLAPQFPFPCGLHDCIAAYLYLLTVQEPSEIILAGDSAGGGMVLSLLCTLRDQGIPLPAGAVLISPWVDLTHSFPSVSAENNMDYIPPSGFHHKPSRAWPPPNEDDMIMINKQAEKRKAGSKSAEKINKLEEKQAEAFKLESADGKSPDAARTAGANKFGDVSSPLSSREEGGDPEDVPQTAVRLSVTIDGKLTTVKDQIQMYTTNELLPHPLVSPVCQPTLGGLPPLLIMVGGGEVLRDEQIYLAHKCANPSLYAMPDKKMTDADREKLNKYGPTVVQLQVWDDLCHVAPTLSFTRPAKYMYRSVAQFGAWALARAQHTEIDILDDDDISVISSSGSEGGLESTQEQMEQHDREVHQQIPTVKKGVPFQPQIGKAGDKLPPFKGHMIRQRVSRHGLLYTLAPPSELPACNMDRNEVGVAKEIPVKRWLESKRQYETRYASARAKVHQKIIRDIADGFVGNGDGENPPPTALAGRCKAPEELKPRKKHKSLGLAIWSLWGSKHDEMTVGREKQAEQQDQQQQQSPQQAPQIPATTVTTEDGGELAAAIENTRNSEQRQSSDARSQASALPLASPSSPVPSASGRPRSNSRRSVVRDENQTSQDTTESDHEYEDTFVAELIVMRRDAERKMEAEAAAEANGVPSADETTKTSDGNSLSPSFVPETGVAGKRPHIDGIALPFSLGKEADTASMMTLHSTATGAVGPSQEETPVEGLIAKRREAERKSQAEAEAGSTEPTDTTQTADESHLSPKLVPETGVAGRRPHLDGIAVPFSIRKKEAETASMMTLHSTATGAEGTRPVSPMPSAYPAIDGASAASIADVTPAGVGADADANGALPVDTPGATPGAGISAAPSEGVTPSVAGMAEEDVILSGDAAKMAQRIVSK